MILSNALLRQLWGDAHIAPAEHAVFTENYGKFVTSQRADVGIGPYNSDS